MNLIIDVGNTFAKVAVFQEDELLERIAVEKDDLTKKVGEVYSRHPGLTGVILSKVSEVQFTLPKELSRKAQTITLGPTTRMPFQNCYATPETLGSDRKALAAAAAKYYPKKNVLIIDAGTCITYDFINAENQYLGGAISPGLRMRYKALNTFTAGLPLLETQGNFELVGKSTEGSINSGVINGLLREMDGTIEEYAAQFQDILVIMTGGDAEFLSINLKNTIFANSNFLLEGLNHILEFNISQ